MRAGTRCWISFSGSHYFARLSIVLHVLSILLLSPCNKTILTFVLLISFKDLNYIGVVDLLSTRIIVVTSNLFTKTSTFLYTRTNTWRTLPQVLVQTIKL